ncbi:C40 family peptidase [Paenibacillus sp. y28]|uniref:C40 family peptidase n=1 Tax=Paenibacillus sp. y28 TaxID=3129110 RepID=UPI003015FC15
MAALAAEESGSVDFDVAEATSVSTMSKASNIISYGKRFLGVRYQFGAKTGSTSSFDCSSFTQYVYKQYGINLPRSSKAQSKVGKYVSRSNLKPGDLVFFYSPIHHVGIYIGNGKMLNTYGSPGVTISNINSSFWSKHYTTARRVL